MNKGIVLPLAVIVLLAGCHGDSDQGPVPTPTFRAHKPAAAKRGPTPEELTAGMVEAVTLGKSTAPIAVKFDLASRPMVGKLLEVVIAVLPQTVAGSATLQFSASEGLQLAPDVAPVDIPAVDPAQVYRVSVSVTPTADGVQLLGLDVALKRDELTETRSFSVPIIVAAAADKAAAAKR